jgi:hypothetical protein
MLKLQIAPSRLGSSGSHRRVWRWTVSIGVGGGGPGHRRGRRWIWFVCVGGGGADLLCGRRQTCCSDCQRTCRPTRASAYLGSGAPSWRPRAASHDNVDDRIRIHGSNSSYINNINNNEYYICATTFFPHPAQDTS